MTLTMERLDKRTNSSTITYTVTGLDGQHFRVGISESGYVELNEHAFLIPKRGWMVIE